MFQNFQDTSKQQIEDLAILIQKLKNDQLSISQKIQASVQKLEQQNQEFQPPHFLLKNYNHSTNNQETQSQNKENQFFLQENEHWSFSENSQSKSPTKIITLNSSITNQNVNADNKSQSNNIAQGFTLYGQDSSYQHHFTTQGSNFSLNHDEDYEKTQNGFINTTNATTTVSNQDSPKNNYQHIFGENHNSLLKNSKQENKDNIFIIQDIECQVDSQQELIQQQNKMDSESNNQMNKEINNKDSKKLIEEIKNLQKENQEIKIFLKQQSQQIATYQEIIKYKDEQLKKQQELEDSMKKIMQGLLEQLRQSKQQVQLLSHQKQESQSLLFGLEEEYQKVVSELNQKKNQIKYILNENIQLEKDIAELKRDYELKLEEKYNSQYNQNYQAQIEQLLNIVQQTKPQQKDNSQNIILNSIQKQLTQQLRQINESELKIQLLRKQNKKQKQKLLQQAMNKMQLILMSKKLFYFKQLCKHSFQNNIQKLLQ
ncbi:hypothetical protein TTHERM_00490700 (macronuclear) [Tetrahymena thermophila SB210]|uniref:Uncharacterized protein n=1 Tax=Tetrahymena thermophila (strain SB210) TaxID=312017 RepID=Q23JA2_TETTS|nr:hypothetical protein TTHERM_00490700 [Tetrahymena thermophila SB210]EAR96602.2 hypothetical protein TTHERM_00490700 [Tetrahymena thermophila SB210]|eukprot:XP_001016847.2 hypothetical protein TTHERM_00490700 [Tetrahymena thermophila SB210]